MVRIELVYVPKDGAILHVTMDLKQGATVADALMKAEVYDLHPEIKECSVGIYAKQVPLHTVLKDGDRVEIYRPLLLDPKEKRRQRARTNGL